MILRAAILFAVIFLSGGCTFNGTANLYPANEVAQEMGAFSIPYKDIGLQGALDFTTPDGEAFKGNYSTIDSGVSGYQWGNIYAQLGTTGGYASTATTTTISPASLLGQLHAYGSRGTSIECEYTVNRRSRSGVGACVTNRGAMFKMHFSVTR